MDSSQTRPAAGGEAGVRTLKVALLGCGGVGSEVYRLLGRQAADLEARIGVPLEVAGVAVRGPPERGVEVDPALLTGDAMELATRPGVDIVVEVIGGIEPARSLLLAAMKNGKSVVSANKALLAEDGATLHQAARDGGTDLYYEAAVGGAIPLLRPLRESLAGDAVRQVLGIVNGTTNYILDRMDAYRASSPTRWRRRRRSVTPSRTRRRTSRASTRPPRARSWPAWPSTPGSPPPTCTRKESPGSPRPTSPAPKCSATWSSCSPSASATTRVSVRVHPAMIPRSHPLAGVREAYNAVFVEAESAGRLMFYGAGAGGIETASAVLGDVVAVARNRLAGTRGPDATSYAGLPVLPMGQALTRYHIALDVADRPGCWPGWRSRSPGTRYPSRRSGRRGAVTTPSWSSSPIRHRTPRSPAA